MEKSTQLVISHILSESQAILFLTSQRKIASEPPTPSPKEIEEEELTKEGYKREEKREEEDNPPPTSKRVKLQVYNKKIRTEAETKNIFYPLPEKRKKINQI
ncbi:hypothetical protein JTB14_024486 [Gonioctena quinquepunctata]|nr:hypothetical protein JTB14_024486 [Gonioctena quinquepunctata]